MMARETSESKTIPTKRVYLNDPNELPSCYSSTPGGTLYSTTPGGTKIVYEKSFLLNLRNSPISKTPPTYGIPDNLIKGNNNPPPPNNVKRNNRADNRKQAPCKNKASDDDHQFQMDI